MLNLNATEATESSSSYFVRSSDKSSVLHILRWEAQLTIKVTLKKEAGSLPVKNTAISYQLVHIDPDDASEHVLQSFSSTKTTPANGEVHLSFVVDPDDEYLPTGTVLDGEDQLHLKIVPSQQSEEIHHEYMCDDEMTQCGAEFPHSTPLSHLSSSQIIQISDITSVPMTGVVSIGRRGTHSIVQTNCKLRDAEVCLKRVNGRTSSAETDTILQCTTTSEIS